MQERGFGLAAQGAALVPLILVSGLILLAVLSQQARAQVPPGPALPPLDPSGRSAEPPPLRKERPLAPKPEPLQPEPPPALEKERRPLPPVRVFVRRYDIVGNTVFSGEELAKVTGPYTNREITTEDLEALRLALTLRYVNAGYVTSGAIVPDQTVEEGIVRLRIIEGTLSRIDVEGTENFWPYYFRSRIALAAGPPVNVNDLQERLQLLQQDPRVNRINAELRPGVARGESELAVKVTEESPYKAWVEFNNFQTPTVGAERGLATYSHQSLTGNGDIFTFTYGRSAGVDLLVDTFYSLPLTAWDTTFIASYRRNEFEVVEEPFDALEIESESEILGFTLQQPVYRTLSHQVSVAVTGEYLFNKTSLGGEPFPFISGFTTNAVANVSAIRFIPEWVYRTRDSVLAGRMRFSVGLDVLDATVDNGIGSGQPNVPNGQFFSWLGQVQAVKRLDGLFGTQLFGRVDVQLADDRLFPLEQFPVGGRFTVRGYRENTFVRDNGIVASIEGRVPVVRSARGEDVLQVAPFVDYGSAWNSENELSPDPRARGFLASAGVGLRWNILPNNRARFEVYWGKQLNRLEQGEGNLQDHGVHLQAVVQLF